MALSEAKRERHRKYMREVWYPKNRAKHIAMTRRVSDRVKGEVAAYVNELKDVPCPDCKRKYPPVAMDFDHLPGSIKEATISALFRNGHSLEKIKKEIEKCEVVCSNCHRIRTQKRKLDKAFGVR